MATSHDNNHVDTLPPSPPPSPPNTRRRHPKKKHDAFDDLPITPIPSPPASPPNELAENETMWTKVVVAPVMFTSFLLSLFLVDFRERTRRTRGRPAQPSFFAYFSPTYWLDPEPYQDPDDATWSREASGHVEPHDSLNPDQSKKKDKKRKSWHLNKKIRKIAKLEISDAFEMRGRVIVGMVTLLLISGMAVWMGGRWVVASLSHSLHRSRTKA